MRRRCAAALGLVCALVLSGCSLNLSLGFGTDTDGRFDGTEIEVPVLYAAGTSGGVTTQRITAASADGGELRVDITENDVSGVDPVTQSATWTAVTAATLLTGARPDTAYTFGFDARIATPAAGAVTAVGVLALYYGTEIQPGVALTGAVTPFGAIRPVAGLAAQMTAAVEAGGLDTILVPAGQRLVRDADGNTVDLDQLAATGGMTVTEVADVASAYAVMTGEDLPEATFPTPPASPTPLATVDADADEDPTADDALGDAVDAVTARVGVALEAAADPARADAARALLAHSADLAEGGDAAGAFAAASAAADEAAPPSPLRPPSTRLPRSRCAPATAPGLSSPTSRVAPPRPSTRPTPCCAPAPRRRRRSPSPPTPTAPSGARPSRATPVAIPTRFARGRRRRFWLPRPCRPRARSRRCRVRMPRGRSPPTPISTGWPPCCGAPVSPRAPRSTRG